VFPVWLSLPCSAPSLMLSDGLTDLYYSNIPPGKYPIKITNLSRFSDIIFDKSRDAIF